MAERERVQKAIEGPVGEAAKLIDEARGAEAEIRLMMLIDGWGRGLSAGLEELALAIESLRRADSPAQTPHVADSRRSRGQPGGSESTERTREPEESEADEERLRERAAESRGETAALRKEASSELDADHELTDEKESSQRSR
jgi:hypothetical protein